MRNLEGFRGKGGARSAGRSRDRAAALHGLRGPPAVDRRSASLTATDDHRTAHESPSSGWGSPAASRCARARAGVRRRRSRRVVAGVPRAPSRGYETPSVRLMRQSRRYAGWSARAGGGQRADRPALRELVDADQAQRGAAVRARRRAVAALAAHRHPATLDSGPSSGAASGRSSESVIARRPPAIARVQRCLGVAAGSTLERGRFVLVQWGLEVAGAARARRP